MYKDLSVSSDRLTIRPNSLESMLRLYDSETDLEMKQAYYDMITEMRRDPQNPEWACEWSIYLIDSHECIGGICFKGAPNAAGEVEVGYGILEAYQNHGYATEAVDVMVKWAFEHRNVNCVLAQTEEQNAISQRVLAKNSFVRDGYGDEGPMFKRYR